MAWEIPSFCPGGLIAGADLSAKQYYAVKITASDTVGVCDTDGEHTIGILQNKPNAVGANVMMAGISKAVCSEALAAGDFWGVASDGRIKKVEGTITGADVGDFAGGKVINGTSAANELATITVGLGTFVVEAQ